jgi:small-conductance mechanosensitive channel
MKKFNRIACVLVFCLAAAPLYAQHAAQPAVVQVDGQTIFVLHTGVGSFTPAERAEAVNTRITGILSSHPAAVHAQAEQADAGWLILVNGQPLISVTEKDAAAEHLSEKDLAARWTGSIQQALGQAHELRSRQTLWRRIALAALVLIIALAVLWGLLTGRRRLFQTLDSRKGRIRPLKFRGLEVASGTRLHWWMRRMLGLLFAVSLLLVAAAALLLVFGQLPSTQAYARQVFIWIWDPLRDILLGVVRYLPNLFYILVIIAVTRVALRSVRFIFEQADRGSISLEPWVHSDVARPTSQILKAIIVVLALFFIAPLVPGTGSTAAKGISVILGLMVSFGSTSTVGNLIAGIVLTYMRPFRLGDRVKLGETVGDVIEKTFLYTKVLTIKNEEVMVPSLQAIGGALVNYSARGREGRLILHTTVTIGYDAPWQRVHELLVQAAGRTSGVAKDPAPFVYQTALQDFYVAYQLNVYTDRPREMARIYAELHQHIQDSFNEGGVEICSPHYAQLRDGNATTIPAAYLKDYEPPRLLVDARLSQPAR